MCVSEDMVNKHLDAEELNHASIDERREAVLASAHELGRKKCLTPQEQSIMTNLNLLTLNWLEDQKN